MEKKTIILEVFEGPLDLLLHLIQKHKIDIYDIPIADITEQYLAYLKEMETFNIEVASEFLLIAATLISIKVRMLLPKTIDEETGEEEDPRKELVERLLEYERYKEASDVFKEMLAFEGASFFRQRDDVLYDQLTRKENPLETVSPDLLKELATYVLLRATERKEAHYEVRKKQVTIKERITSLLGSLRKKKSAYFDDISGKDKSEIVLSFLALLELYKEGIVYFIQEENFSPVKILLREGA